MFEKRIGSEKFDRIINEVNWQRLVNIFLVICKKLLVDMFCKIVIVFYHTLSLAKDAIILTGVI